MMRIEGGGIGSEFGLSKSGGYQADRRIATGLGDPHKMSFVANGRSAMMLASRSVYWMPDEGRNRALLPAYLCHSMIQPFVELGLQVCFYRVGSDLSINPTDVSECIDGTVRAVLLMHYFGFEQEIRLDSWLAERFPDVTVIDDRTHMLFADLRTRTTSAAAIRVYSPRKWGPLPDIGIVVWPDSLSQASSGAAPLDKGYDHGFALWRLIGVLLRALFFAWPSESLRRLSLRPFHKADALLDRRIQLRTASPISRFLWRHWNSAVVWHTRRSNFQYLLDNWPSKEIQPLYDVLPKTVCPLGFPIRTLERESLRRHLISKEIFPPIHWLRPSEVSADDFPEAARLAEQELTIPIDQRYGVGHMERILDVVCKV